MERAFVTRDVMLLDWQKSLKQRNSIPVLDVLRGAETPEAAVHHDG